MLRSKSYTLTPLPNLVYFLLLSLHHQLTNKIKKMNILILTAIIKDNQAICKCDNKKTYVVDISTIDIFKVNVNRYCAEMLTIQYGITFNIRVRGVN